MKNDIEMYHNLLSRYNDYQEKRKKRIITIKRTAFSVSGICAAVAVGFGIRNNEVLKNSGDFDKYNSSSVVENPTEPTESSTFTTSSESTVESATSTATDIAKSTETSKTTTDDATHTHGVTASITKRTNIATTVAAVNTQSDTTTTVTTVDKNTKPTSESTTIDEIAAGEHFSEETTQTTTTGEPLCGGEFPETSWGTTQTTTNTTTVVITTTKPMNDEPQKKCLGYLYDFAKDIYTYDGTMIAESWQVGDWIKVANVQLHYIDASTGYDEVLIKEADVFKLKDYSEEVAVAVKYIGEETYYIYVNKG